MSEKIYKTCISCEGKFYINEKDQEFFASCKAPDGSQLAMPKRCYHCRKKREAQRRQGLKPSNKFSPEFVSADSTTEDTQPNYRPRSRESDET